MERFWAFFLILGLFSATHQQGKSVKDLVADLFKNTTTETKNPTPTDPQTECVCVPYYLCTASGVVNTKGEGIIDIRADDGPCENFLDVCCNMANVTSEVQKPKKKEKTGCGWRNGDGVGFRITGDKDGETQFGEFPWMVAVLYQDSVEGSDDLLDIYQCGGSLIHPQAVITSAHCVKNQQRQFKVRVGEWDTQMTTEIFPHQDRQVKSVTVHPQYYAGALFNDVAFLVLDSPVNMTYENVGVACLPPQDSIIPSGTRCFATGWGRDQFGQDGKYQVILKKIELPIVDREQCQGALRQTRLGRHFELDRSFVCAGGEAGKDTCKGDGGSPLVCPIPGSKGRYQQVGIVAWGIGCGEEQIPGVYANVALFRDWINEQAAYNNLGITSYEY